MSLLALGLDAPNRCDLGSRGRGELGRLVVRWGSHRTVETRDRGSGDFCSRVQVQAAFSAEASAATNISEPPPPTEQALDLPHAADVAHRPSWPGIEHLADPHQVQPRSAPRRRL